MNSSDKKDPYRFTVRFDPIKTNQKALADFLNSIGREKAEALAEMHEIYLVYKGMVATNQIALSELKDEEPTKPLPVVTQPKERQETDQPMDDDMLRAVLDTLNAFT